MAMAKKAAVRYEAQTSLNGKEVPRRLSDKILMAFSHAYAIGEVDVARHLREVLVRHEERVSGGANRGDPVHRADMWVAFVDARERYKKFSERAGAGSGKAERALEEMKEAYRQWCGE